MAKLFSTRELFYRYKWLGNLRMKFLIWWCNHGTTFFDRSYRRVRVISPGARPYIEDVKRPVIFAMYHGSAIAVLGLHPRKRLTILISNSRDGEMIAQACEAMGFSLARGSSARGAVKGALELLEAAEQGQRLAMMVDGPKGPAHEVKAGPIRLASLAGIPIIPLAHSAKGSWYMKSWDRFDASSWGTPKVYVFGDPIHVPPDLSDEQCAQFQKELGEKMHQLQLCGDQLMALAPN